ncbi:MFS transporter [Actinoplanes sp. Pm04-4]|uniref:MFS transporter n=1 Tax=Paractinoplanes pyxinae TaxID=2997416 RepID=A0ABT4AYH3_9ACTN|nr:MFS transporter [Actinoplanes pyxinae]MCY1138450.1 MFS transporter [Actinoplanes pyxinae]
MAVLLILRNRRFLALWSGNALSLVGTSGVRIAYPLLALALFDSPALAGWVAFAATLPNLLLQVPAGLVADTVNRRTVLLTAQATGLLATAAVLLAAAVDLRGMAFLLVVAAVVEGSAFVFFNIAEVSAVRDVVDEQDRTVAFSFLEAEQPIGNLAGRAAGGALFDLSRWAPFLLNAFSYVFCLLTLATMPKRVFAPVPVAHEERRLLQGLVWLWRIPYLRLTSLITGFTNVLWQCVILLVLVVATRDDRPAWTVGVVLAAAGVGGLLAALVTPRLSRRFPPRGLFLGCVWVWTGLLAMIAVSTHTVVLMIAWGGVGAVGTVVSVTLTVTRAQAVPDNMLGRIVSAAGVITDGAVPIGALVGGYLLAAAGPTVTARVLLIAMLAAALLCTRFLRPAPHPVTENAA